MRERIGFKNLYVNTNVGKIPADEYRPVYDDLSLDAQQSGRAYHEFKKASRNQLEVIGYHAWVNNYNWYPFLINNDDWNPQYHTTPLDRTTINLVAQVVLQSGQNLADHKLVVIGMEHNIMSITNFSSVVLQV